MYTRTHAHAAPPAEAQHATGCRSSCLQCAHAAQAEAQQRATRAADLHQATRTPTHTQPHTHTCIHTHKHVHMHACTHTQTCVRTRTRARAPCTHTRARAHKPHDGFQKMQVSCPPCGCSPKCQFWARASVAPPLMRSVQCVHAHRSTVCTCPEH